MHYLAAVSLDGFYISALSSEDAIGASPLVLIREKTVLDASESARSRGVTVGQSQAEARSILGKEGQFLEWKEGRFTKAAETWLDLVASFTGTIEPTSEHSALLDLSGHPNPLETATELRDLITEKLAIKTSIGLGPNPWIAEASCANGELSLVSLLTPRRFIAPLSTLLLPIEWKDRERLMALGYRTIGAVAEISDETLRELFRKRAHTIALAAQGMGNPRITASYPKGSRAEVWCFSTPPDNWSELEDVSKKLAVRLGRLLSREDVMAHDIEVVATLEDGSREIKQRTFTKPVASSKGIERSLSLMLKEPFHPPVERLLVRLKNLQKPKRVQQTLEGTLSGTAQTEALAIALQSVQATFGAESIAKAGSLPLSRYKAVRRAWTEANGWTWR